MKPLNLPEKGSSIDRRWEYTTPMSIKILAYTAALVVAVGLIILIAFVFFNKKGGDITIPLVVSVSVMTSSIPLYVLYHVADDIHYMSFIAEKQESERSETTLSFFDDVNQHLAEQTALLGEIANIQNSLLESMGKNREHDNASSEE